MIEDLDEEKINLNKETTHINRGFELLIRNRRRAPKPKTFQVKFGKMISLLRREFYFYFEFHIDVKKANSQEV
tara:strand:+ start:1611 stop:1829 length:219 start_codon:yes stop_codon:yes gene_type:complete